MNINTSTTPSGIWQSRLQQSHTAQNTRLVLTPSTLRTFRVSGAPVVHRQGDSCHFKNICVQNSNVLFYLQTIGNNISLDVHKRFIHLEPGNVLPIHPFYSWRDSSKPSTETLQLQVLKTPIPSTAVWGESSVTAFAHSAWWHNIGHFIMDGMYPLFNLMRNFNMICRDLQIVSFPGPG